MEMYKVNGIFFASTYGSGTYNSTTYNGATTTGASTSGGSSSGGTLANTGFTVAIVVTIAAVVILIALLVKFFRKPKKSTANDPSGTADAGQQGTAGPAGSTINAPASAQHPTQNPPRIQG